MTRRRERCGWGTTVRCRASPPGTLLVESSTVTVDWVLELAAAAVARAAQQPAAAVQAVSFAEALSVIARSGLDQEAALQVLTNSAPGSPVVKMMAARMTARQYVPPNFALRWMLKDVRYAIEEVQRHGVRFDTAVAARGLVERAMASGHADEDFSVVVEPLRESR
jgi:3-hydroxyisobutyrate dehydrogenase-like beta-hydroxyacid dehydrogenase